jgi:hypothetical protein
MTTTATARLDTLTPIHKGIRRSLFETAMLLARTDFSSPDEVGAAEEGLARCLAFLREHAEHEDRHVLPELARLSPELADELRADHPRLERLAIEIENLWPRIERLAGPARAAMGAELVRRFNMFVGEELQHMDREEREENAVLWAHLRDEDLAQISRRIVAGIDPARMREWGALLEPALSRPERTRMAPPQAT